MITEDYVSFETAKLLKEKGFEQFGCDKQYNTQGDLCSGYCYGPVAPTLQMVMKWLREVHHIFIRVIQSHIEYCTCEIYYNIVHHYEFRESFNTYEEACEAAIKYCLEKLI